MNLIRLFIIIRIKLYQEQRCYYSLLKHINYITRHYKIFCVNGKYGIQV